MTLSPTGENSNAEALSQNALNITLNIIKKKKKTETVTTYSVFAFSSFDVVASAVIVSSIFLVS